MNRQNYRAAFDAVDFSPDFEERTLQKLAAMRHASEKEQNKMSMNRTKKITLLAAAAVVLLAVTVSAAVLWLTPAQVAEELNDPMLAEAFQSDNFLFCFLRMCFPCRHTCLISFFVSYACVFPAGTHT